MTAYASPQNPACPLCGSARLTDIFQLESVSVICNQLWPSTAEARAAASCDIDLAYCEICSLVSNRTFRKDRIAYAPGYENALHSHPVFRQSPISYARIWSADTISPARTSSRATDTGISRSAPPRNGRMGAAARELKLMRGGSPFTGAPPRCTMGEGDAGGDVVEITDSIAVHYHRETKYSPEGFIDLWYRPTLGNTTHRAEHKA